MPPVVFGELLPLVTTKTSLCYCLEQTGIIIISHQNVACSHHNSYVWLNNCSLRTGSP
jgi:hypothetical protein